MRQRSGVRAHRPWFCWVGFGGPHEPWDAPAPYSEPVPTPPNCALPLPAIRSSSASRPRGLLLDDRLEGDAERLRRLEPSGLAAVRANYAGKVSLIDHWVGELLEAVESRGELDRTLVLFTSDHGEMNGDHGLFHKSCFLEGAIRVPLILRAPGSAPTDGSVVDCPVELIDVGPTLAEAASVHLDYPQWGRSLWPILRGEAAAVRDVAVSAQQAELMLVGEQWKVALNRAGEPYLCVDLVNDPDEGINLAGTEGVKGVELVARTRALAHLLDTQLFDEWF